MMTREELMNCQRKQCYMVGAVAPHVDAYKLMEALNVETLDDLFKVIDERFSFDTHGEFLKANDISFAAYAF